VSYTPDAGALQVHKIASTINALETISDDEIFKLSLQLEPRGASKKDIAQ